MDFGIQGKVAMVAAASKGIGLAVAQALVAEGCRVSICARSSGPLEAAARLLGPSARAYEADVSNPHDLERWLASTVGELGSPSILVTNTGGPPAGGLGDMEDDHWSQGVESTLMSVVRLYRLVSPMLIEGKWGRIVHLTSLVAKQPAAILPISSTLRAGLMALTRLQATEMAPHGVTVNSVLPGHTLTDRQRHLAEVRAQREHVSPDEALRLQAASVPIGRLADPSEIASPTVFLCSQQASYITGVNLLVDGGIVSGCG